MYKYLLFLIIIFSSFNILAQGELNCNVTIDATQKEIDTQDKALLDEVKNAISTFLNTTKWTTDTYGPEERIRCNLAISITNSGGGLGSYEATAQIQSSRPIYGGSYESLMLNFIDKQFNFTYVPGMVLQFNENIFQSELTSLLGFYAYVIIGTDYDSFSKLGGTVYYEKLRNIVNNIQNPSEGWKPNVDPNNRAGLMENLTNQLVIPVRESMYTYHRVVLDNFQKNREDNVLKLIDILKAIQVFNNAKRPNAVLVKSFFNAKTPELINIFSKASPENKSVAIALLADIDPTNNQKYQKILESK